MKPGHQRRKEQRPAEILAAAFDAFSANGFAGTRLEDVAERAGITKGTIYVYFASKEDLFIAALKEQCRPLFDNLVALAREPSGPALAILKAHLDFSARDLLEDARKRDVVRMLMGEGQRFPELVERWHDEVIEPGLEAIATVIRYGVARGEFRPSAVDAFPHLILAPTMLAINWLSIYGDRKPLDFERLFAAAFDLFAHGLCA